MLQVPLGHATISNTAKLTPQTQQIFTILLTNWSVELVCSSFVKCLFLEELQKHGTIVVQVNQFLQGYKSPYFEIWSFRLPWSKCRLVSQGIWAFRLLLGSHLPLVLGHGCGRWIAGGARTDQEPCTAVGSGNSFLGVHGWQLLLEKSARFFFF